MLNFPKKPGRKPNEWTIKDIGPCKKLFKKFDFPSLKTLKSNESTLCTMQGANKLHFKLNSFQAIFLPHLILKSIKTLITLSDPKEQILVSIFLR